MASAMRTCCLIIVLISFSLTPLHAQDDPELSLITVTGDAEVRVVPDEVILTLGVETWNEDLSVAKNENDQRIQQIMDLAEKEEIEEKHIQTDHISIMPRYDDQWEHRDFVGYFVRRTIAITLRDPSRFEEILSGVLESGANYVHGIQFQTTKLRTHRDEARALAILAAKEKAVALAKELGQNVGTPHRIQEGRVGWWSGYGSRWGNRWGSAMAQNVIQNAPSSQGTEGSVALGQIKVHANVTVSFKLE